MLEKLIDISKSEEKSYFKERIENEMKFALLLSKDNGGKYDELIDEAENYIVNETKNGMITEDIMKRAEEILAPISAEAKSYELMCVAHAHIDMNWQWGWDETVEVVIETTRSILKIMEEYPSFKFSQSQASVYKILEDFAPELLAKVKERVAQGRWEVSASTWVEADKNMPSTESAVRQILYAKKYLSKLLDISMDDIVVDFEPDTFGHSINVPEILNSANIKYYYHSRGMNDCEYQLYTWKAPSGASIIANRERNFYFMDAKPDMGFHGYSTSKLSKVKQSLQVYGVGDHGGGPTRRDVERLMDMNKWPIFPRFTLSTYKEFFEAVEKEQDKLPVYRGEINFIFDGCFSSQSRNKLANKDAEHLLYKAELYSVMALGEGKKYSHNLVEKTWRKVLLNQFHDIITGSGVRDTREYAMGNYQDVKAATNSMIRSSFYHITDKINTKLIVKEEEMSMNEPNYARAYGAGVGSGRIERGTGKTRLYHIFNPNKHSRKEVIELTLWEWYGDPDRIEITDSKGNEVEHQLLESGFHDYWYHNYMKVLIYPAVPGMGYTTIKLTEGKYKEPTIEFHWERRYQERQSLMIENEELQVCFCETDVSLASVIDKKNGAQLLDQSRKSGIFQYIIEGNNKAISQWRSEMSSWLVGRFKRVEDLNDNLEVVVKKGRLRESISFKKEFHHSSMTVNIMLDKGSRQLKYTVECDWHEIGNEEKGVPRLQFLMPVPYENTEYIQDVPMGVIARKERGIDVPALSFTLARDCDKKGRIGIASKDSYGYRCDDDSIALVLLRSSFDPDPYPENGICIKEFCVDFPEYEMTGDEAISHYKDYGVSMDILSGYCHGGGLPLEQSFIELKKGNVQIDSVKASEEDSNIILRLYESNGENQQVVINFSRPVQKVMVTDLLERELLQITSNETKVELEIKPYSILTMSVSFVD